MSFKLNAPGSTLINQLNKSIATHKHRKLGFIAVTKNLCGKYKMVL